MGLIDMSKYARRMLQGKHEEVDAVSKAMNGGVFGDTMVYMSRLIYHLRRGYTVATWLELPLLLLQSIGWIMLRRRFAGEGRATARRRVSLDIGLLAAFAASTTLIPSHVLPALCLWTIPLAIISYMGQAKKIIQSGAAAPLPLSAVVLRWTSCLVRVFSTAYLLAGDAAVMASHAVGLVGCSLLLWVDIYHNYARGPVRMATRRALYSGLLSGASNRSEPPDRSGLQMWLSLGGFGDCPPALLPEATLHKAFDAIDADGNGSISREELQVAIIEGTVLDERTRKSVALDSGTALVISQMIAMADMDGDGKISFADYQSMITSYAPLARSGETI